MTKSYVAIAVLFCVTVGTAGALGAQSLLLNGSMEIGKAIDDFVPDGWELLPGNVERSAEANSVPSGDGHAIKAFGDPDHNNTGVYQEHAAAAGNTVTVNWSNFSYDYDKLSGTGSAGIRVEFRGFFGNIISSSEVLSFNDTSAANTWVAGSVGPLTVPANTTNVRVYCKLAWSGAISGAVFWDDVHINVNSSDVVYNGDFEIAGPPANPDVTSWGGFGEKGAQSSDAAVDGQYSLKIDVSGSQYSGRYQPVGEVFAGDHLLLKGKVMHPSSDPITGADVLAGLKLEFQATTPSTWIENLAIDDSSPEDVWTLLEVSTTGVVIPADYSIARITVIYVGDDTTSNGRVFFDSAACYLNGTGPNRITNAGFESGIGGGLDDWATFETSGSSLATQSCWPELDTYHDGDCACRVSGTAVAGAYQDVDLGAIGALPGDTLDVSAYVLVPSWDPLYPGAKAGVKVQWISGSTPPNVDIVPNVNNPVVLDENSPTDTWIDVAIDYTMPAGTGAVAKYTNIVAFAGSGTTGTVYFDNCEFVVLNRFDGADGDGDADEDLADFAHFQRCYDVTPLGWNCTVFDSDDNGAIDQTDYSYFGPRVTGPQ